MISERILFFIFIIKSLLVLTYGQPELMFFRTDYTNINGTRSYYKLHTKLKTWRDAKTHCKLQGTKLFYPENFIEADAVINYINTTQPSIDAIFVGISAQLTKGVFLGVDGVALRNVYNEWVTGEPNDVNGEEDCVVLNMNGLYKDERCNKKYPYLCKKTMHSFKKWNNDCNTPYLDYKYSKELDKCYKFHSIPKNWKNAVATCEGEQAYLAIPNSPEEANYLSQITNAAPKDFNGRYLSGAVHLGYRFNETRDEWITLKGDTLEKSGYAKWDYYQPDGGEAELCGTMFYSGQLNDISCENQNCFFICEKDNDNLNIIGETFAIENTGKN